MTAPFAQTITLVKRVKAAQPDALGNDTWTTQENDVLGAFYPGQTSEFVQGQDMLYSQPVVYLAPDADVSAVDAVRVDGETFEVDGKPSRWYNPLTGARPGVEVHLKRVTG